LGAYHSAGVLRGAYISTDQAAVRSTLCTFGRGFHGQLGRSGYYNSDAPVTVRVPSVGELRQFVRETLANTPTEEEDPSDGAAAEDGGGDERMVGSSQEQKEVVMAEGLMMMDGSGERVATCSVEQLVEQEEDDVDAPCSIASIECGGSHCAALTTSGQLLTWGLASSGELGHGGWTPIEVEVPRPVSSLGMAVRVVSVAAGANHTLAVGACGGLWSCGRGRHGQLGQGHFHDVGPLQRVEVLRGVRVRVPVSNHLVFETNLVNLSRRGHQAPDRACI
jgi:alpha-tubulin suppressor-like RCC1 family protein